MRVTAVLVCHDGARWLPAVIEGIQSQTRPVDRVIAIDTGSLDATPSLLREAFGDGSGAGAGAAAPGSAHTLLTLGSTTSFPEAVRAALAHVPASSGFGYSAVPDPAADDDWLWLLHDDSNPAPDALERLVEVAQGRVHAHVLGPKLREWPSLRRLLEMGVTISGTGRRETGLERGEYDQGQHDRVRRVLAVNTAGMLVRRDVLEQVGGFDTDLPMFGNDIDFGWRAARAGFTTLVVPDAVVFHAEAAHRGVRRTALTGRHTHFQERRAALHTLLANASGRSLPWHYLRLLFGSLLRVLGFLIVRSPGEALDELAAVLTVVGRPGRIAAARRARAGQLTRDPREIRALRPPWWLPYRHGLDLVSDFVSALSGQASDVAERRRDARLAEDPRLAEAARRASALEDDEEAYLTDSGWFARFLTNPVALAMTVVVAVMLVSARVAFGPVAGGALSKPPISTLGWWRLYVEHWHVLGTGTDVPAPAYVAVLAALATLLAPLAPSGPAAAVSVVLVLSAPVALAGAWRLLRVIGRLVDPRGLPRWLLVWGAVTYALVPVVAGAWGEGRLGTVAVAAVLPWLVHAGLSFADPDADRRARAGWRVGLLLTIATAFLPLSWVVGAVTAAITWLTWRTRRSRSHSPRPGESGQPDRPDRTVWGPPLTALGVPVVLLSPWWLPLLLGGYGAGIFLEPGRLPLAEYTGLDVLIGRSGEFGAPWALGALLAAVAVLALVPLRLRRPVILCWLVIAGSALLAALVSLASINLTVGPTRPGLSLFMVVAQGAMIVAAALGASASSRRLEQPGEVAPWPVWQRAAAAVVVAALAFLPAAGLLWWLVQAPSVLATPQDPVVPAYMEQSSLLGPKHGVLVLRGSVDEGIDYRVRRGDGVTLGEDEILALATPDRRFTDLVRRLVSTPNSSVVAGLAAYGIEYVVIPAPVDGRVASALDASAGLIQASAQHRSTRAWQLDRPLDASAVRGPSSWLRVVLLVVQAIGVVTVLILAGPTLRPPRPTDKSGGAGEEADGDVRRRLSSTRPTSARSGAVQ